jgi:hypothetical protein
MCLLLTLLFLGPRAAIIFWWLANPGRWDRAFDTFIWPFLGFLFLPWTTIMFVAVAPTGNVEGWDWLWLGLGLFADFLSYSGGGLGRRSVPGYPSGY